VTRLLLWRHGETAWNRASRVQGQTDTELSALGRDQATAAAPALAARRPDLIVSSDLRRCVDTAAPLAELTGVAVEYDPRLRERGYGRWQGCELAEIAGRWPAEYARWRAGEPVGGLDIEEIDDVAKRVAAALREAVERAPDGTVVAVTHGGASRHGLAALLGWGPMVARTLGPLDNCHWSELHLHPVRGWQLAAHNVGGTRGTALTSK
jgi:probable phosphoglycerate mutase